MIYLLDAPTGFSLLQVLDLMSAEIKTDLSLETQAFLDHLEPFVKGKKKTDQFCAEDATWLSRLPQLIGRPSLSQLILTEGGTKIDVLDPAFLQQNKESQALLEKLYFSLKAMQAAQKAGPEFVGAVESDKVIIHNREVAEKLCQEYEPASFEKLFSLCREQGVFALKINEQNGLVTTAEAAENWDMSGRQWVTDTVRCGDIERSVSPHSWTMALLTLCDFYHQEEEMNAIKNSIADPDYYRLGGLLNGVAHIFIPHTLKRDTTWFNNKRLESHGLALRAICDTVAAAASGDKNWAFTPEQLQEHGEKIAQTIVSLASYLKAINTDKNGRFDFAAPSAGPWEEIPFPEGLTWDTEAIRSGFASLRDLLFSTKYDGIESIAKLRKIIFLHALGQWLQNPSVLDQLIRQARGKIIDRLFGQELPIESPQRPMDCSLAFIATSTITFDDDTIADVHLQYQLLQALEEKLVRTHGIIRYAPFALAMEDGRKEPVFDSYLADNYWLMPELRAIVNGIAPETKDDRHFGSSDCSTHEDYLARVKMARGGTEAQWCFVSVIAEAYCLQVLKLQKLQRSKPAKKLQAGQPAQAQKQAKGNGGAGDTGDTGGPAIASELERLIAFGTEKACEYINRSYARITAAGAVKANGRDCPAWAISEAFEQVSPTGAQSTTHAAALPGANTPLAWGQASLFRASELFRQILSGAECAD